MMFVIPGLFIVLFLLVAANLGGGRKQLEDAPTPDEPSAEALALLKQIRELKRRNVIEKVAA